MAYRRSPAISFLREPRTEKSDAIYKNPDDDHRGVWTSAFYVNPATKAQRPNLVYPILNPVTGKQVNHPTHAWKFDRLAHEGHVQQNLLWWGKNGSARYPRLKVFPKTENAGLVPLDIWKYEDSGTTDEGGQEVKAIFGSAVFTNPKPTKLIRRILRLSTGPEDIVLDFFAGSGTTAHAVQQTNAEDSGKRRFILVSNTEATPEEPNKNLCHDVCAERARHVIQGFTSSDGEKVPGLGGDFAYLRCRRIPLGKLLEIDHAQVWTTLQLIHREVLAPYAEASFLWSGDQEQGLLYVPRFRREDAPALRKQVSKSAAVILYSWQPETLRQHVSAVHVQHEPIPESLARRFGLKT